MQAVVIKYIYTAEKFTKSFKSPSRSMFEVPASCEHHGQAQLVCSRNHLVVPHAASWLDNSCDTMLSGLIKTYQIHKKRPNGSKIAQLKHIDGNIFVNGLTSSRPSRKGKNASDAITAPFRVTIFCRIELVEKVREQRR